VTATHTDAMPHATALQSANSAGRAVAGDAVAGDAPVLRVQGLSTSFATREGTVRAVAELSYDLRRGETLAVVGESGCGKSVGALSLLRLIPQPPGRITAGAVWYGGRDLLTLPESALRDIRGREIAMIFQEPMTALNPVLTIGRQVGEVLRRHLGLSRREAWARSVEMLRRVRIPEPERRMGEYPHQLSGGMRQRVMIAMALVCRPQVLIADEPTTALDVTIQAQILDLMRDLQAELGAATLLITHDLGVVAEMAQRVVVMYAGRKVEEAPVGTLFTRPRHPYTLGLLASMPRLNRAPGHARHRLAEIPGTVPPLHDLPPGCAFAPRCTYAVERCRREAPPLTEQGPGQLAACWEAHQLPEVAP